MEHFFYTKKLKLDRKILQLDRKSSRYNKFNLMQRNKYFMLGLYPNQQYPLILISIQVKRNNRFTQPTARIYSVFIGYLFLL